MNPRPKICQSMLGNQVALQSFSQKLLEIKNGHCIYHKKPFVKGQSDSEGIFHQPKLPSVWSNISILNFRVFFIFNLFVLIRDFKYQTTHSG